MASLSPQPEPRARYACDRCRARKVSCTRTRLACQRCRDEGVQCTYSRVNVVRRNRKPLHASNYAGSVSPSISTPSATIPQDSTSHSSPEDAGTRGNNVSLESQLAIDIEATRQRLDAVELPQHDTSLGALASLSEAYATVWHDASAWSPSGSTYFLFEQEATAWTEAFITTLDRGRPLFQPAPAEVIHHLRASRPHLVPQRAWLVMYYSIVLSIVSSTSPHDQDTKSKLRCNLWVALNDVRLLLEPSEANIQALVLLAAHVEEFTTPLLCWMLVSNACRMLQALGVNHRRLDPETRARRTLIFWHLNLLDKGLALVFGRSPTFHRAMVKEIALPTLSELLFFKPHRTSAAAAAPGVFGSHYLHQMFLISRVNADVCSCIYDETEPSDDRIESVCREVEEAYRQAREVLEAAALTEKPFLDASSVASIDLGLRMLNFQYHYLMISLSQSSASGSDRMKAQCVDSSKKLLHLLDVLVSDSEEPYNGIVWQLICCPFTPFLRLFGEILSNASLPGSEDEKKVMLDAIERFPIFLTKMGLRNSLASKLERVAVTLVKHARSVVYPAEAQFETTDKMSNDFKMTDPWPLDEDLAYWDSIPFQTGNLNEQPFDLSTWTNEILGDGGIDWIGGDGNIC